MKNRENHLKRYGEEIYIKKLVEMNGRRCGIEE